MSPRTASLLTFIGALIVGAPLPWLTCSPAAQQHPTEAAPAEKPRQTIYAILHFSGQPQSIQLKQGSQVWDIDTSLMPAEQELELELTSPLEIELKATWNTPAPQAITLTLEPDGKESRSVTQWKDETSNELHHIFSFQW